MAWHEDQSPDALNAGGMPRALPARPAPSPAPAGVLATTLPVDAAAEPTAQTTRPRRRGRDQGRRAVARVYQALVELAPDATVVVDQQGYIRLVNRQTEVLFGYPREELLGQPVEALIPARSHAAHQQHRAAYAAAPHTRPMGLDLQLFGQRRDGSEFPVEVSLSPVEAGDAVLVISTIRDISECQRLSAARQRHAVARDRALAEAYAARVSHELNTRLERERAAVAGMTQALDQLEALQALTDTALAHLTLEDLLPEVLDRVQEILAVDNAAILLVTADGQALEGRLARGAEAAEVAQMRMPVGAGFAGRIAATHRPLVVADLAYFPGVHPLLRARLRSVAGVPLLAGQRLLGVLYVGTVERRAFSAPDMQLLERAGERIALAIDWARLFEAEQAARAEAEQLAEQLDRIIEGMGDGLIAYDAQGQVIRTNPAVRRMMGLNDAPPDYSQRPLAAREAPLQLRDAQGRPLAPEDWPVTRALQGEALTGADAVSMRVRTLDGREMEATGSAAPLRDRAGRIVGAVVIVHDQTERNRLEREREAAQASELAVREINRHLDEFFRTAAHDLRQPITAAKGHADLAARRLERMAANAQARGGKQAEQIARVLAPVRQTSQGLDRLARLSSELFDIARARTGTLDLRLAPLDVAALVQEQVAAQRVATPTRTIGLELPTDGQPAMVQADADRLGQVLANYLTNALKYSANDQPVVVRLEVTEGLAVVSVQDHGPGLPWEEQSRVWEMLHRAPGVEVQGSSGTEGSLGLGLYICKRLMELHPGGRVGVESLVGEGSTFWFRLPLASATPPAPSPPTESSA
jgi:PAS domain S-box-containing protein